VLPSFDVEPEVAQVDPGLLRVVWLDEVLADGVGDNLMYRDISGTAWPEVEAVILEEDELIRAAADRATVRSSYSTQDNPIHRKVDADDAGKVSGNITLAAIEPAEYDTSRSSARTVINGRQQGAVLS
jgi:hypothetical protein